MPPRLIIIISFVFLVLKESEWSSNHKLCESVFLYNGCIFKEKYFFLFFLCVVTGSQIVLLISTFTYTFWVGIFGLKNCILDLINVRLVRIWCVKKIGRLIPIVNY